MIYALQYFDEVEADIVEAILWYKSQKEGLELKFLIAIEKAIETIIAHPKIYSIRYKKVRIAHPKTFPFNIHYYLNESKATVVIIGIIHNKRHPSTTKKRK